MDQRTVIVLIVAVIVIAGIALLGWLYSRQRRSQRLRQQFGPEYERVLRQTGDQRKAEGVLEFRTQRREKLHIRRLEPTQRSAFFDRWTEAQSRFVDDPNGALTDADLLINEVMAARGYPMSDFEQRASDVSVDHPVVVENYRAAHGIAVRRVNGESSTEDLRRAMVHYRALFEDLLEPQSDTRKEKMA